MKAQISSAISERDKAVLQADLRAMEAYTIH